ncbi:hypothetical protein ACFQZF_08020 [Flavobacterium myungsuense]|uniref:hypothetical protein n=1 Tax=Flavobacterium myungsuense TaxID=651823 RepID=UPI00362A359A
MRIITLSTKKPSFFLSFFAFFISLNYSFAQCPTVVNAIQSFCDSRPTPARVSDLIATDNGGGVRWYIVPTGGTALNATTVLNPGSYYADSNAGNCGVRPRVDVTFFTRPSPFDLPSPTFCVESTVANLQQKINGNDLRWYLNPTGGSQLASSWPLSNNIDYYASQFISSSGCETLRSRIRVRIIILAPPTGNPVQQICSSPSPRISDFTVNIDPSNTISWYFPSGVEIVDPFNTFIQEGDLYKVTQSDNTCESLGLSVYAIFEDPNNAGSDGAKGFCISDLPTTPPFDLYDLLGGNPDKTGVWSGDLPTIDGYLGKVNISSLLPGDYNFNYEVSTSTKCAKSTSKVTISVLPLPTVSISTKRPTVCSGTPSRIDFEGTPLATVTYTVNGVINTIVLDPDGEAWLNTTQNDTFELVSVATSGTPSCSQNQTGSVTITVLPLPTVSLNSPSICPGETATLTATPAIAGTYTYEWEVPAGVTNPGNVASFTTTIAGTYTVTITNLTTSCKSTIATGAVTLKLLPTVSLNSPSICPGETATLTATPAIAGTYTYEWEVPAGVTNPGNVASFPTTIAGTYTVTITNLTTSCKSAIATGTVTLKLLPTVSLNSPSICPGETATLTATPSIAGTYTYEWEVPAGVTNPGNVASFTTTIAGTYTVTITNLTTSCKSTIATGTVTLKLLPTVSLNSPSICPGETATLTATPAIAGTYTYEWEVPSGVTNPGNVASFPTTIAGTYTVTITNLTTSCKSAIATGTVTLKLLPTVSLNSPSICPGETATLTAIPAIAGTYTYEWEVPAGVTNPGNVASFTTTIAGTYTVTITNLTTSCKSTIATGTVTLKLLPTVSLNSPSICPGETATLTATPAIAGTYTYEWEVPAGVTNPGMLLHFRQQLQEPIPLQSRI